MVPVRVRQLSFRTSAACIAALMALIMLTAVLSPIPTASAQAAATAGDVVIAEIFYNPDGQDEAHEFIKLANTTGNTIDLSGWSFSTGIDFVFEAGSELSPSGFVVITADTSAFSAIFAGVASQEFSGALANGGETITLVDANDTIIDTVTYDDLAPWPAGADGDGDSLQLLDLNADNTQSNAWVGGPPSPAGANNPNLDVRFSVERGWYDSTQQVTLTSTRPGATIRYATNAGAISNMYQGPITVTDNGNVGVIRAQATLNGATSAVVTHTFVFSNGGSPVVAIWPNPVPVAEGESEATVHVEFLPPPSSGLSPVAGYAGLKASDQGVSAGQSDKLFFRGTYGTSKLIGDLFGDRAYGAPVTTEFDQLFLRNEHLDNTHLRQIMAHDAMDASGQLAPHGRFVEYRVNGADEGVRHLQERPEGGFMESYTDIDKSRWLAWSGDEDDSTYGRSNFGAPYGSWSQATAILNVEHLIDSLLVQWQANVADFRGPKNYRVAGPLNPAGGDGGDYRFHFFNWDMDLGYRSTVDLATYPGAGPTGWRWSALVSSEYVAHELDHLPQFRLLAADRIACAHFGAGSLTAGSTMARLTSRNAEYVQAGGTSQTTFVNNMATWIADRNEWLLGQYRQNSHANTIYGTTVRPNSPPHQATTTFQGPLFPESDPLSVSTPGGLLQITGDAPGTIYYRLDGGDPRTENGTLAPQALAFGSPTRLPPGRHEIIARAFNPAATDVVDRWSPACNEATAIDIEEVGTGTPFGTGLVINELHYNPAIDDVATANNDDFEFIELVNTTTSTMNVGGMNFSEGIDFAFALGATVDAGGVVVLAANATEFLNRYGFVPDGEYGGLMANSGDLLVLVNAQGDELDRVDYDDLPPWPVGPDGGGPSLALIDAAADNSQPQSWSASTSTDGSPGQPNTFFEAGDADCDGLLTINDAAVIARFSVGLLRGVPTCAEHTGSGDISLQGGDADGSGEVIILDAYKVAQCVVGLPNQLCP